MLIENLDPLHAISAIDGRYHSKTNALSPFFSEFALMKYRILVELRWFQSLTEAEKIKELPTLKEETQEFIENIIIDFNLEEAHKIKAIEARTNHDVKAIEYYISNKFSQQTQLKKHLSFIHFACTSEDINNIAYALMLKDATSQLFIPKLHNLLTILTPLAEDYAQTAMLSRTHGQTASPTTLGKEIANFIYRLKKQCKQLETFKPLGKINGAVGNYNAHKVAYEQMNWLTHTRQFIEQLGLEWNPYTTQIEPHDYIAEFCDLQKRINTILIDFSRDIWGYISLGYFKQKTLDHEVGSSTMPHKVNPIDFENAEGNLGMSNAMLQFLSEKLPISRWQRDLTDSTLLRTLGSCLAHVLIAYHSLDKGINKLMVNTERLKQDLENAWETLAEPIQTVMRKYGHQEAYEQLKMLTRGKKEITKADYLNWLETLLPINRLTTEETENLNKLTPETYIGFAGHLAKTIKE